MQGRRPAYCSCRAIVNWEGGGEGEPGRDASRERRGRGGELGRGRREGCKTGKGEGEGGGRVARRGS